MQNEINSAEQIAKKLGDAFFSEKVSQRVFELDVPRYLKAKADAEASGVKIHDQVEGTDASGGYLVPPEWLNDIVDLMRKKTFCRAIFPTFTMGSNITNLPTISAENAAYVIPENTSVVGSDLTFGNLQFEAYKFVQRSVYSTELDEDSRPGIVRILTNNIAKAIAEAEENAILNGDTGHLANAATPLASSLADWYKYDPRTAWDGLRKHGGTSVTFSGAFTLAKFRVMVAGMRNLGFTPSHCFYNPLIGPTIKGLDELETLDKYGPKAVIFTGEIGKVDGISMIESRFVYTNLDATLEPVTLGDETEIIMVDADNSGMIGTRRTIRMVRTYDEDSDAYKLTTTMRSSFNVQNDNAVCIGTRITVPT